ncbi:MAG: type I DNA topoisomerase, partial [Proteobacteria bacterium]|nr:type I DNA topoisomerase [Pseudomonadota bacterium]
DVVASFGHIRDLPSKNGSVDPEKDFSMNYEVSSKSYKHVAEIVRRAKDCDKLILAPDPDREGESIAWHVLEALKQKKALKSNVKVERVVFNAITKQSVTQAMQNPRQIDMDLVNAQQARRALDYLVGFTLSPVLWRKLPGSKSAGRVQSVALRVISDREDEIESFKSQEYWDIRVDLANSSNQNFSAALTHINGDKLDKFTINNQQQAHQIAKLLEDKNYQVSDIKRREVKRKPYAPFITSSLQQEASRKLGFSTKKTMQIAQKLYEGLDIDGNVQGLITYMRTDGVYVAPEAINSVRDFIKGNYGHEYLPLKPINYKGKIKNAQEAHEAIRPTSFDLPPKKIAQYLDSDYLALYELIWKRMVASQMADVVMDQVSIIIQTNPTYGELRASGSIIKFDGFRVLYNEDKDDDNNEDDDKKILPKVEIGEQLKMSRVLPEQHFTEPPPRYGEASLVKKMEELGIGRPSTYSSIISVLQDRGYVKLEKRRFIPEERGRVVTAFLKEFFSNYVEYNYTALLEDELDIIASGKLDWKTFLSKFWVDFDQNINQVMEKTIPEILESLNKAIGSHVFGVDENGALKDKCQSCDDGTLGIKIGRYGVFVGCSNYPTCKYTRQIAQSDDEDSDGKSVFEPKSLGVDDEIGGEISIKKGPYGFYLELTKDDVGEEVKSDKKEKGKKTAKSKAAKSKAPKPKRVSIPKNIEISDVDMAVAKKLLSLPREVGIHPETGLKIVASIGPFGPYLLHDKKYSSVKEDDILEIGLNRAVTVIADDLAKKAAKASSKTKTKSKAKPKSKKKS